MKIGFTGTQKGMTPYQKSRVVEILCKHRPTEVHAGDCIGADADFYHLVRQYLPKTKIIGHIPDISTKRAKLDYDVEMSAKPYLVRNHAIVDATDLLVATPKETGPRLRSGTWATIRYAFKQNKPVIKIYPTIFS